LSTDISIYFEEKRQEHSLPDKSPSQALILAGVYRRNPYGCPSEPDLMDRRGKKITIYPLPG
jgi:hypothetical protein